MSKKFNSITGVTLIEILIGIVISTMMMAAMYTSYNVVNSTYSQVTDTAKISQTGRDVIGMIIRDIRMAGYKYFNDNIQTDVTQHIPILITKKDIISLGGINSENIKYLKMCRVEGFAGISWIKKNGPSINTGPF